MRKRAKYLIGVGIVLGSLTGSYFVGQNQGFDKGYKSAKIELKDRFDEQYNGIISDYNRDIENDKTLGKSIDNLESEKNGARKIRHALENVVENL